MFKGSTITLTTANVLEKLAPGRIVLPKGKKMRGARFKCTVPMSNTRGGGATTALTTDQRKELLNNFQWTLSYGYSQQHKVYKSLPGNRMRQLQRYAYGSEMEGYSDSSTGLAQTLTNGGTTNLVFYPILPLGAFHQLRGRRRKLWGVGRSQAQTIEIQVKFLSRNPCTTSGSTETGLTISGNVTLELLPDCIPCKGDQWSPLAEYDEFTEKDKRFTGKAGLPLLLIETSEAHTSANSTNVSVFVDGELMHDQVSAAEIRQEYLDNPELLSEADISDEVTVFLARQPGDEFHELQSGNVIFIQNVKDLSEAALGVWQIPVIDDDACRKNVSEVAKLRGKNIRAVSLATSQGWDDVPNRLRFALPWTAFDQDDVEFERFPGLLGIPGSMVVTETSPKSVLDNARQMYAEYTSRGESKLAQAVAENLAAVNPNAIQQPRGFGGGGSVALARILEQLRTK